MLQEINQNQKANLAADSLRDSSANLAWWRTWTSSWGANVYF